MRGDIRLPLVLLGLVLGVAPLAAQGTGDRSQPPIIEVMGETEVTADPDVAYTTVAVVVRDPSPQAAMDQMSQRMDRVLQALRDQGVAREQMKTVQLSLNQYREPRPMPRGEPGGAPEFEEGFQAVHRLQLKLSKSQFNKIGQILNAALQAGANEVGSVSFGIEDEAALHAKGLRDAVENARKKADSLADAAGVVIVAVQRITESGGPRPLYDTGMEFASLRAAGPQPIPPSEITRRVTVMVQYAIRQR